MVTYEKQFCLTYGKSRKSSAHNTSVLQDTIYLTRMARFCGYNHIHKAINRSVSHLVKKLLKAYAVYIFIFLQSRLNVYELCGQKQKH